MVNDPLRKVGKIRNHGYPVAHKDQSKLKIVDSNIGWFDWNNDNLVSFIEW